MPLTIKPASGSGSATLISVAGTTTNDTLTLPAATGTVLTTATAVTPAQGGTGTNTVFTAGSVVFAGASGVYSQDNGSFYWDDTNNRLGIGTVTPSVPLSLGAFSGRKLCAYDSGATGIQSGLGVDLSGNGYELSLFTGYNGGKGRISFGGYDTGTSTYTQYGFFDPNGYLLVGYSSSNGAYKLQVNSQIFATNTTIATSDARYKENVAPITDGLAVVNALNPVSFDWKQHLVHDFDTGTKTVGFLAQEVQAAMADKPYVNSIVKESECELPDGTKEKFLGIAEGNMVSILTKAIQELSAELNEAKARIAALEAK